MKQRGDSFAPGELKRLMRPVYRAPVTIRDASGRLIAIVQIDPVSGKPVRHALRHALRDGTTPSQSGSLKP